MVQGIRGWLALAAAVLVGGAGAPAVVGEARPADIPGGLHWQTLNEPGCGGAMVAISIDPYDTRRLLIAGDMLGVGVSTDRGDSWGPASGFKTWEMADFTWHPTDPSTVWVGSMSGPYVSHDRGLHWQQMRNGMPPAANFGYTVPVEKVLFDPRDSRRLLAFGGSSRHWQSLGKPAWGAVWESHDGGQNWSRLTTITREGSSAAPDAAGEDVTSVQYAPGDPDTLYAAAVNAGFLASVDGGKTWTRRASGLPPAGLGRFAVHPKDKNIIWIAVDNYISNGAGARVPGGIYKTTDGGQHWFDSSKGLGKATLSSDANLTSRYFALGLSQSSPNVLYTNDAAWSTGVIYKSTDGGANWFPVATRQNVGSDNHDPTRQQMAQVHTAYPAGLSMGRLDVDPQNPELVYGINSEFIVRTRDGGRSWDDATAAPIKGTNAWRGRGYSGLVSTNFRFDPIHPGRAMLEGMDAGKLWLSTDGLKSWTMKITRPSPWNGGNDISYAGNRVYATFGQFGNFAGIGRSTDDGDTWTVLGGAEHGLPDLEKGGHQPSGIYARPDAPEQVWAIIEGVLYHTADGGDHWKTIPVGPRLGWIAADPANPGRFYISGEKNVYETGDAGTTFTAVGGPHQPGRLVVDSRGRLYAAADQAQRAGLWRYDPTAAERWTRLLDETWISNVTVDPTNPNRIAITTNQNPYSEVSQATGVWISADGGKTWSQQNDGLAMTRGFALAFNPYNPEQLVWGSDGRGFWITRWARTFNPVGARSYTSTPEDANYAAVQAEPVFRLVIKNGDMSVGGDAPAFWGGGSEGVQVRRDTEVFHSAPASLEVIGSVGKSGSGSQTIQGGAGATFTIEGWIKCANGARTQAYVQAFAQGYTQNQWIQLQYVQGDTDWMHFSKEVTLPPWTAFFNVGLMEDGAGKAWIDDLHEAGQPVAQAAAPE